MTVVAGVSELDSAMQSVNPLDWQMDAVQRSQTGPDVARARAHLMEAGYARYARDVRSAYPLQSDPYNFITT